MDQTCCPTGFVKALVCISGKRKAGKDFVSRELASVVAQHFPNLSVSICTLSDPLKEEFAILRGIDASKLKDDGSAKESVRKTMIAFGEALRARDVGYFCRKALAQRTLIQHGHDRLAKAEVVIVSDCRRPSDIAFFRSNFPANAVVCVRIECSLEQRQQRGFVFCAGVDDAESECAMDNFEEWDFVIQNEGQQEKDGTLEVQLEQILRKLEEIIVMKLK